jgi:hypothetical protein
MTIDPINALLVSRRGLSLARSALPDAPVVPEERTRLRALPFGRRR